jgi:hypothetical protein
VSCQHYSQNMKRHSLFLSMETRSFPLGELASKIRSPTAYLGYALRHTPFFGIITYQVLLLTPTYILPFMQSFSCRSCLQNSTSPSWSKLILVGTQAGSSLTLLHRWMVGIRSHTVNICWQPSY